MWCPTAQPVEGPAAESLQPGWAVLHTMTPQQSGSNLLMTGRRSAQLQNGFGTRSVNLLYLASPEQLQGMKAKVFLKNLHDGQAQRCSTPFIVTPERRSTAHSHRREHPLLSTAVAHSHSTLAARLAAPAPCSDGRRERPHP